MELIERKIERRSCIAIKCLPFNLLFYNLIKEEGITANKVFLKKDKYFANNLIRFQSPSQIEDLFCWLITIGILRREVDGQGLTAKVRLTPLGKQILSKYPKLLIEKATRAERIKNWFFRKIIVW